MVGDHRMSSVAWVYFTLQCMHARLLASVSNCCSTGAGHTNHSKVLTMFKGAALMIQPLLHQPTQEWLLHLHHDVVAAALVHVSKSRVASAPTPFVV